MFNKQSAEGYVDVVAGVRRKTLVYGAKTLMTEFVLAGGHVLPDHKHPYEQTGYLVSGHIVLKIGEQRHEVRPGDAWCVPADVTHGAEIVQDSVAIEVFAPVREDYLP